MFRPAFPLLLAVCLGVPSTAQDQKASKATAQDPPTSKVAENTEAKSAGEQLKDNANDRKLLQKYMSEAQRKFVALMYDDPDAAARELDKMQQLLDSLEPDQDDAKRSLASAKRFVPAMRDRLVLSRTPLADLAKRLESQPNDAKAFGDYLKKLSMELGQSMQADVDKAEKEIQAAKELLAKVKEGADDTATKRIDNLSSRTVSLLERRLQEARDRLTLLGSDALPLNDQIDAWANGGPLSDDDLKGKVVLLDFWAVWCGPCIATFPQLREWREKYADKGLVIVGVTRYYGLTWDEENQRPTRPAQEASNEQELAMLEKFCSKHQLHHGIALQTSSDGVSRHYKVSSIPHVVVIDRQGKVQMIRVSASPQNAKDVGAMLEQLIGA